ncbi:hypothetical protein [Shewanella sp. SR43-8]|uniref:hypothetical protein n=1 Tax=Shewanella sp. SR43-8 TaxID=2760938 RepID=UPI0016013283|nr:hypothetical protein [Shewanella sp. SR43-8]MBB1322115.1 hypothetical protein [Shewanella sp. SR43-8]
MEKLKNYLTQWSTWRGIALIGAAVAGIHPDAANAVINLGDAVVSGQGLGVAAVGAVGAWEAFRNERKKEVTKVWRG